MWPYYNRGFTYSKKGEFRLAIADYGKVIKLDPSMPAAYTKRGVAYEAVGDPQEAVRDYRDALRIPKKYTTGQWAHDRARERLVALDAQPARFAIRRVVRG